MEMKYPFYDITLVSFQECRCPFFSMFNIFHLFILLSAIGVFITNCRVHFVPERVKLVYVNEKYFYNYSIAIKRYGRKSGYYINIETTMLQEWNNNVTLNILLNEFLHNEYKRSFIELHYKFCDLLKYEKFFAPAILGYGIKCPVSSGVHRFMNLTIPMEEFPNVFPFERARVDIDYTVTSTNETMAKIYLYASFKNKA